MHQTLRSRARSTVTAVLKLSVVVSLAAATAGAQNVSPAANMSPGEPMPDPRVGLKAGVADAGQAAWNLRLMSATPPSAKFLGSTNSDLAFIGPYAIQGSYNGFQIWNVSNPSQVTLKT
ncbi:MAG TPA: hypothetical protein VII66_12525, partial [Gemmatimonadaceae bacterium]